MEDCIFCRIVRKEIPARIVREDADTLAFEDIHPQAPVHVLIIPKEHIATLNTIPEGREALLGKLLMRAREIAAEKGIGTDGYRCVLNTGRNSGMEVSHIHLHLLGGRRMTWPPG